VEIEGLLLARLLEALGQRPASSTTSGAFEPGQILEIQILAVLGQEEVLLELAGQKLAALNHVGLKVGQKALVQIEAAEDQAGRMILRLVEPPPALAPLARQLKAALPGGGSLGPALEDVLRALSDLPARPKSQLQEAVRQAQTAVKRSLIRPGPEVASRLRELPGRLGLDLEPVLARAAGQERALGPAEQEALSQGLKARLLGLAEELTSAAATGRGLRLAYPALHRALGQVVKDLLSHPAGKRSPTPTDPDGLRKDFLAGLERRLRPALTRAGAARAQRQSEAEAGTRPQSPAPRPDTAGSERALTRLRAAVERSWPRLIQAARAGRPALQQEAQDLERNLIRLLIEAGLTPQKQAQAALNQVQNALRNLELVQLLNLSAAEHNAAWLLPLALPLPPQIASAQVHYYRPPDRGRSEGEERPHRLVFLLEMSRLGPVRVDLGLKGQELMINIYLNKPGAVSFVKTRLEGLREGLAGLGYSVTSLGVRLLERAPAVEEIAPWPSPAGDGRLIDLKA